MDDPDILDFVELRDAAGTLLEPGSEAADAEAVTGRRRTPLAARLKALYDGDVRRVDAFVGMVAEPHVPGSELGELQQAIWRRQFQALRDGDRFFYRGDPALRTIAARYGVDYRKPLSQIIVDNTELEPGDLQANVFEVAA